MKPLFLTLFAAFALSFSASYAQIGSCEDAEAAAILEVGNVRALIPNNGGLFWKGSPNLYEAPKGKGVSAMFASTFLVGGLIEDELRISASTYGPYEFWPGPLDEDGNPPPDCSIYDNIWEIKTSDFEQYEAEGTFSFNMLNWPWELGAPVIDGDGIPDNYNLEAGDRPELLGDQMLWWVMNDRGNEHLWTEDPPIGLEVRVSVYAFENANIAGDITFYRYQLTNKNTAPFTDAYLGMWADPDLGNFFDDYVGSDSLLHLSYTYNSDPLDEDGYEDSPPAIGYTFLKTPKAQVDELDNDYDGEVDEPGEEAGMYSFSFNAYSGVVIGDINGTHMYNRLQGLWLDGQPITYGGDGRNHSIEPTRYMYTGDPVTGAYWTEFQPYPNAPPIPPSDRRFMTSSGPFTLNSGETTEFFMALVWAQGSNNLDSVRKLKNIVANMQETPESYLASGYNAGQIAPPPPTPQYVLGFDQNFPNPFTGTTTLRYSLPKTMQVRLAIYDILGREIAILSEGIQEAGTYTRPFDSTPFPPGIYFARIELDHLIFTKKLVKLSAE